MPGPPHHQTPKPARCAREQRLLKLGDPIAEHLRDAEASSELRSAHSWGRPLDLLDGYALTPGALRMPMKVLKNAGVVPHEVTMMQELHALRETIEATTNPELLCRQPRRPIGHPLGADVRAALLGLLSVPIETTVPINGRLHRHPSVATVMR